MFLSLLLLLFLEEVAPYLLLKKVEKLIIFCFFLFWEAQTNNTKSTFFRKILIKGTFISLEKHKQTGSKTPIPFIPTSKYWIIFLETIRYLGLNRNILLSVFLANPAIEFAIITKLSDNKELAFFFIYDVLFSTLGIRLPFTSF